MSVVGYLGLLAVRVVNYGGLFRVFVGSVGRITARNLSNAVFHSMYVGNLGPGRDRVLVFRDSRFLPWFFAFFFNFRLLNCGYVVLDLVFLMVLAAGE